MSKFKVAADTLIREAQRYVALSEAAKVLNEVGSLEQAAAEHKAHAAAALKDRDEALDEVVKVKEQLKKLKAEAVDVVAKANDKAAEIISAADKLNAARVADAALLAERTKTVMIEQARVKVNEVSSSVDELAKRKDALITEIADLEKDKSLMDEEAGAAEKRLAKVKEAIAKLSA